MELFLKASGHKLWVFSASFKRSGLSNFLQITAINNIAAILEEAGTSWENALKTTVFLANMDDYEGMNEMYGELLPQLKPARTTVQASKLPGKYLIEMDLVAAIPRC